VPDHGSPTVRRRRLAAELRRLRESAGLHGEEAAARLGWSASKLSRIETSKSGIKLEDLRLLLDLYRVGEAHRSEVLALARESAKTAWVDDAAMANFPAGYAAYVYAEAEAATLWHWAPQVIPGLLQTESYAREVVLGWHSMFNLSPTELDARVEARIRRQQILTREQPLDICAVIDESVLRRRIGDRSIMREQLGRLAESSRMPNVELCILPLDGDHPVGTGEFTYMRFAQVHDVRLPDIVNTERLEGDYRVENAEDTNQYRVAFEHLRSQALDPAQSLDVITDVTRQVWS
jgi:transcriptional regulator with XRE-family HTH domain